MAKDIFFTSIKHVKNIISVNYCFWLVGSSNLIKINLTATIQKFIAVILIYQKEWFAFSGHL